MDQEVMELIEMLYTMVSEAWGVPLGNEKCIVERDKILEILDEIKTALPVELAEAKRDALNEELTALDEQLAARKKLSEEEDKAKTLAEKEA